MAELAPRDVVSRHIDRVMRERGEPCVWLDATGIERDGGAGALARRFPSIDAAVTGAGFGWAREPIPVAPAAHYTMGGIATDLDGRTSVPGLFAAGGAAASGVHGANRLASNSLLEGSMFGARAGRRSGVVR
ncbi:L-aspartate oxidase [Eumeta japonica]|uniref:L-aspartate oxidase n=1 Tax=Eumeta variegata TaxID=151549 RepID=A0A4C1T6C6_EUMVA|nr:L-aspartate oxidase [Eumeta japonica]